MEAHFVRGEVLDDESPTSANDLGFINKEYSEYSLHWYGMMSFGKPKTKP